MNKVQPFDPATAAGPRAAGLDVHSDNDVDLHVGVFGACMLGLAIQHDHTIACQEFNVGVDGDIDQDNLGILRR